MLVAAQEAVLEILDYLVGLFFVEAIIAAQFDKPIEIVLVFGALYKFIEIHEK